MKYTLPFSCIFSACILLAGCQNTMMSPKMGMGMAQTNGQIINDIIVLDKGEIASAKIAKQKATHPEVKRYASYLEAQHSTSLRNIMRLSHKTRIKPAASMTADNFMTHNQQEVTLLTDTSRVNFDRTYVNAMVQDHQSALQLIDRSIQDSSNPKLTQSLKETRQHLAVHLEKAQQLQKQIGR
ncbi:MAG: DUF4142 domain-containing protein [Legionellaceae bacterium]|nr:DUF4142 domain-containing protein [Legionellaceae bacterium]